MMFILGIIGSLLQWANNLTMTQKLSALITMDAVMLVLITSIIALVCCGFCITLAVYLVKMLISFIKSLFK